MVDGMTLRQEFIRLLKEDEEFRLTVAAYIGLDEILRQLRELGERFNQLLAETRRIWEEVKSLREGQEKLWENQDRLWKSQEKLWREVKSLREGQEKLWENQEKLWREVKYLRVEVSSFGRAVGRTLEDYSAAFIEMVLRERGYPEERIDVGRKVLVCDGKTVEVNVFNEDPLVVGEVTTYLGTVEEALREVRKVLERVELAEKIYGRKALIKVLSVANAPADVVETLREQARKHGITLIVGKEV